MNECSRIADQLRRAFDGEAWHGDSLRELLSGVTAAQAAAHPVARAHSIWELVLHIEVWAQVILHATKGEPVPKVYGTEKDWPPVADSSDAAWVATVKLLFDTKDELAAAVEKFPDSRLTEIVPGRPYDFYHLFHGI